ncbi:Nitrogen regulatory protein P-II [Thermogutta terrifontis]|uniref:Nitrogen regulatory protein P-II n=1 Tax=Thermogutta terrifontis TaxID=1331910 RepID=A0A286RJF7_9BACT|nr:P-II family nitrogen regulator [Thermogutta terrifontis]ASV76097.1 Nitrogen regulatory protein P-II [Thermogutta terrifontis]
MKTVIAIVRPFVAERILEALQLAPVEMCTVREVKGFGRQKNYLEEYRGGDYALAFIPKVQITIWVEDFRTEEIVRLIITHARTGRMGDGKIFILPADMRGLEVHEVAERRSSQDEELPEDGPLRLLAF